MSMHERLERIERAYLAALDGRYPETVPHSIWRAAIFAAVPDVTIEEIIEMFRWQARKARAQVARIPEAPRTRGGAEGPRALTQHAVACRS